MAYTFAFVDSVSDSATVRLDLSTSPWRTLMEGTDLGLPPRRISSVSTLLADGAIVPAAVYGNRALTLLLYLDADGDAAATQFQALSREVDRLGNVLRFKPGTTQNVYFRILPSDLNRLRWDPRQKFVTVELQANPAGLGTKQTAVNAVTVYADPAHPSSPLNSNPYFETDATGWTPTGGTFVRSTVQFHQGAASGLFTPDGVTATSKVELSTHATAVARQYYRAQAWLRNDVARSMTLNIDWYTSGDAYISSTSVSISVSATTWTLFEVGDFAPATTGKIGLSVTMTGTPPASNKYYMDEAWTAAVGDQSANGCYVDIAAANVIGDVETPCDITIDSTHLLDNTAKPKSVLAIRRRGTPTDVPIMLQAEAMTQGTNTTVQANDANFSGPGSNYSRCTFSTASMTTRLSKTGWPSTTADVDYRGSYRVFARVRQNTGSDSMKLQFSYGDGTFTVTNDAVTVPGSVTVNQLVDVGLMTFPIGPDPQYDGYSNTELPVDNTNVQVILAAQRVSGAGTMDFDYLLFVPADDCYAFIDWADETNSSVTMHVDGITETVWAQSSGPAVLSASPSTLAGRFLRLSPNVNQRIYFVPVIGNSATETVGWSYTVSVTYYPRYVVARPNTT